MVLLIPGLQPPAPTLVNNTSLACYRHCQYQNYHDNHISPKTAKQQPPALQPFALGLSYLLLP